MRKLPEIDQILAFLAVAEELSFRRAAERLAVDQSALSRRIKDLETRLGFQLFFRTTHAVRLTDAGRSFYDSNSRIVESLSGAIHAAGRIARGAKGSLRIAYMTFAAVELLPNAVRDYSRLYPDVSLLLSYERTQQQRLSLAHGEIDIGLMLGPFDHSEFQTLEVASEHLVVVMPATHPMAAKPAVTVREIASEPLVLGTDDQWDYYREVVGEVLAAKGFRPIIAYEAPSLTGMLGLVRAGLGVTLVPEVMSRSCPAGLITRRIEDAERLISTVAAWRRPADGKVDDFITVLRGSVRASQKAKRGA